MREALKSDRMMRVFGLILWQCGHQASQPHVRSPGAGGHHHAPGALTLYNSTSWEQASVTRQTRCVNICIIKCICDHCTGTDVSPGPLLWVSFSECHSQKWEVAHASLCEWGVGGGWPGQWPGGRWGSLPTQICNKINWKWGLEPDHWCHCSCVTPGGACL